MEDVEVEILRETWTLSMSLAGRAKPQRELGSADEKMGESVSVIAGRRSTILTLSLATHASRWIPSAFRVHDAEDTETQVVDLPAVSAAAAASSVATVFGDRSQFDPKGRLRAGR